jgi:hypothetical protein
MIRATVDPGICGMKATIEVRKAGKLRVKVEIHSDCEKVTGVAASLAELSLQDALKPHITSEVYRCTSGHGLCPSCPVPVGILKAAEIESGLALPRPVHIDFDASRPQ